MAAMNKPPTVFISYSHKDERLANDLRAHLANLKMQSLIADWYDRRILPGQDWQSEIDQHLSTAGIILLLISPHFMASNYCTGIEMQRAMELQPGQARLIPIILRPGDWEGAPFSRLQALPTNAKPVTEWRNRDQAFREIVRGIRSVLSSSASERREVQAPGTSQVPVGDRYFLNHTSFLRHDKQEEFRARTGVPVDHYDIRVILDAENETDLDEVERVEYILHDAYPEPVRVRTRRERKEKFLLKELANGEYLLKAKVYLREDAKSFVLYRYITLWSSGPELP
jgi:uncharacterized protein (DUF2249 family)